MTVPGKIKIAESTQRQKDFDKALVFLREAQEELNEMAEKNQALMLLCQQRIMEIKEAAAQKNMELANAYYNQVRQYYPKLTPEEKKELLPRIQEVAGILG